MGAEARTTTPRKGKGCRLARVLLDRARLQGRIRPTPQLAERRGGLGVPLRRIIVPGGTTSLSRPSGGRRDDYGCLGFPRPACVLADPSSLVSGFAGFASRSRSDVASSRERRIRERWKRGFAHVRDPIAESARAVAALIAVSGAILRPWRTSTRRNCNCPQFEGAAINLEIKARDFVGRN